MENLNQKESLAISIVKSGRPFTEAAKVSGIEVEKVMQIWNSYIMRQDLE